MTRIDDLHVTVFEAGSGSPLAGRGTLVPGRLEVLLHDGRTHGFDLSTVTLSFGGASGKMIFLRDAQSGATASIEAPGFAAQLREAGGGALDEALDAFASKGKRRLHWDRVLLGVVLSLTVALIVFVSMLPSMLVDSIDAIPRSVDRSIGDTMINAIAPESALTRDPILEDAVRTILAELEPHVSHDGFVYKTRVLASSDVNAFALPGGQIVVCAGLIARAERPEIVAGVLAHEIAHVTERHGIRGILANLGISFGVRVLFGQIDFLPAYAQDGALLAAMRGFSRSEELSADTEGFETLVAAGVDPSGLADVFREFQKLPGSEMPGMLSWMSTHPDHAQRIANIEKMLRDRGELHSTPIPIEQWESVREAAARAIAAAPPTP